MEFEETGEKSVDDKLKKYNGRYGVLKFTIEDEKDIDEE